MRKCVTRVSESIDVLRARLSCRDHASVTEQRKMVADCGLALAQADAETADVLLTFG
jgi:hypothetical protein